MLHLSNQLENLLFMKTVLSGIQPTGNLHLGNYLGSIRNWIGLQENYNCLFGIMNLHAITLPQDPKELQKNVLDAAAVYLACGLDPKKSTIFVQSEVSQHAELAWVLGSLTPMGWLNRMTQFKEKSAEKILLSEMLLKLNQELINSIKTDNKVQRALLEYKKELSDDIPVNRQLVMSIVESLSDVVRTNIVDIQESRQNEVKTSLGLYSYPVLMAADILLYKSDLVPVGEDQKQHLELTRDLAGAFNRRYNCEYFKLPEPMIIKEVRRIMSLQDGTKKMSKSDESDLSRINLEDSSEVIVKKVKKAKTDSETSISYNENRPEIYNLLNIFATFVSKTPQALATEYETSGYGKFKGDLAEVIVEKLRPIQQNIELFKKDPSYIKQILNDGKNKAQEIAAKTKKEVFEIVGLN